MLSLQQGKGFTDLNNWYNQPGFGMQVPKGGLYSPIERNLGLFVICMQFVHIIGEFRQPASTCR